MAYSERDHRPVGLEIGPVLSLDDIIDSKAAPLGWLTGPTAQASVCLFEFYVLARDLLAS